MAFNALTYNTLVAALQNLMVDAAPSPQFTQILPQAIQYAEGRLYRELDMLSDRIQDVTTTLTASSRSATCPAAVDIVEGISVITLAGSVPPIGKRNPVERTSIDFIDMAYGNETLTGLPVWFSMLSDTTMVFAPTPDQAYYIEVTGTAAPVAMSSVQQTSPLGYYFPDLLLSGCMVFMSAWQRDVGSQMNPQDVNTWQAAYDLQMKSALEYIQRQKSQDPNWSAFTATPISTPRG